MEEKQCKKCGKVLPETYKHKHCEACRNERASDVKKGFKVIGGLVATAVIAVPTILSKKKK